MKRITLIAACALALGSTACMGKEPKESFAPALPAAPVAPTAAAPATGGIYNAALGYAALHEGQRARRVGDPLTIRLVERTSTSKSAGSDTKRNGGFSLAPPSVGPFSFNPNVLNSSGNSSFKGSGSATQSSTLAGEVSVTIAEVRPNGTALIRGEKRLFLSQGEEWVQISGIVRLSDITPDNSVASSRVADARIHYAGKGSVQRASREGWLSRFFNMISPF
ncbi:MAG: hypothetical protein RIS17_1660 [Pseudomonadota bacterium]|jgi:flagellar L-ring protein precursor FlgH